MFWKNLPDETTPRNAENLSRSERYLQATAGANGDFYVNIDGADGLANGDILKISFPTATNGTSNARLSIDGGGTYINVRMGSVNVIAEELQNRRLEMVYDGTYFGFVGSISGSNENGEWIKYADGIMMCFGSISFSSAIQTPMGALYRTDNFQTKNYPQTFIDNPKLVLTARAPVHFFYIAYESNISFGCFPLTITSTALGNYYGHYIAMGRWK